MNDSIKNRGKYIIGRTFILFTISENHTLANHLKISRNDILEILGIYSNASEKSSPTKISQLKQNFMFESAILF